MKPSKKTQYLKIMDNLKDKAAFSDWIDHKHIFSAVYEDGNNYSEVHGEMWKRDHEQSEYPYLTFSLKANTSMVDVHYEGDRTQVVFQALSSEEISAFVQVLETLYQSYARAAGYLPKELDPGTIITQDFLDWHEKNGNPNHDATIRIALSNYLGYLDKNREK